MIFDKERYQLKERIIELEEDNEELTEIYYSHLNRIMELMVELDKYKEKYGELDEQEKE